METKLGYLLAIGLGLCCHQKTEAQNRHYGGLFPTLDHSGQFSEKWSYHSYNFAAYLPNTPFTGGSGIFYIYTEDGLNYSINDYMTVSSAYVYERQRPIEASARNEHRVHQQLDYTRPVNEKVALQLRLRTDERFLRNAGENRYRFVFRSRLLVGAKYQLSETYYLKAYSEQFFEEVKYNENWSALQFGIELNENNRIETGYLHVGWIYNEANNWLHQHYLQITWVNQLKF